MARRQHRGLQDIGSYENVLATFRKYDKNRDGRLAFRELHDLMSFLNKGNWSEDKTTRLLLTIDADGNGGLDIEELLRYIFPRSTAMSGQAGLSDYEKVLEFFRGCDADRSGALDKAEFTKLMGGLRQGAWTAAHTNHLWASVDKDSNGNVDSGELVSFIFGVPYDRRQTAAAKAQAPRRRSAEQAQAAAGALVVIDFVVGPGQGKMWADRMTASWTRKFGDKVDYRTTVKKDIDGVYKVSARDGQVVFWDKPSMMMYRDDPFLKLPSAQEFMDDVARRHIPRLISGTG